MEPRSEIKPLEAVKEMFWRISFHWVITVIYYQDTQPPTAQVKNRKIAGDVVTSGSSRLRILMNSATKVHLIYCFQILG